MVSRMLTITGYLAVWAGLYMVGAALCVSEIAGADISAPALWAAFLMAIATYLLDRVKPVDHWRDPADAKTHPDRDQFMRRRARSVRMLVALASLVGVVALWKLHPLAAILAPACLAGVLLYANPLARSQRLKDRLIVKNVVVALCVSAFAVVLVGIGAGDGTAPTENVGELWSLAGAGGFLFLVVLGDAAICDIPDAAGDRAHGVRTIASVFGARAAWGTALGVHALAAALLMTGAMLGAVDLRSAALWALAILASWPILRATPTRALRDVTDARLIILALAVMALA